MGCLTKRQVKMAGYWRNFFFGLSMDRDGFEFINMQKKNKAKIQPS